jgi:hypothetical protein
MLCHIDILSLTWRIFSTNCLARTFPFLPNHFVSMYHKSITYVMSLLQTNHLAALDARRNYVLVINYNAARILWTQLKNKIKSKSLSVDT